MYSPIQTERLYEQIVLQIESSILSGDLKIGDQLPAERVLAEQFSVSRTAVREAVKTLREKGLIEILPGRGTFITNRKAGSVRQSIGLLMKFESGKDSVNLVEVREMLEPEIAALAAIRITDEYLAAMSDAIQTMESAIDNVDLFAEADLDFHLALAEATQNPIIPILMDSIIDLLREQRKKTGLANGGLRRGQEHHRIIMDAVTRRDPDAARQAMHNHMHQVRDDSESTANPEK
jgi:GntR family transcriptional repressor for pyruvate dehydrogenase complex